MKKKVINKGYTLTVTSWENDGDNYRTKAITVETKEEANKIYHICKDVFVSCNNGKGGVGNSMEGEEYHVLKKYVENHKGFFPNLEEDEEIIDYFADLAHSLMGGSEYYDFRICESCIITYSPEDIYLEEITF